MRAKTENGKRFKKRNLIYQYKLDTVPLCHDGTHNHQYSTVPKFSLLPKPVNVSGPQM